MAGAATITASATGCLVRGGTPGVAARVQNTVTFSDGRALVGELDVYVP